MDSIELEFDNEMKNIYVKAKAEIGYTATRFIQLVSQKGGKESAKQLIAKDDGTSGFATLWEKQRLDLSVEALVLRPEYEELFSEEERKICKNRLVEYGYKF